MIRAAVIFLFMLIAASAAELDAARFLAATRAVENFQSHDGRNGERGPYQLTYGVWIMHMSGIPFAMARQEGPARLCASRHLAWLQRLLRRAGIDPSAFNLALAWNAGLEAATHGLAPIDTYLYAGRVENLYLKP